MLTSQTPELIDARRCCITPGLIDCHTHLVYGGNRAREFELRLKGATYQELQQAGGGILSTVNATRNASVTELLIAAEKAGRSAKTRRRHDNRNQIGLRSER